MPTRKTRRNRKFTGSKRGPTTKTLAKRIHHMETKQELKYVDVYSTATIPATGLFTLLNGVSQGSDQNERDGNEVTATSVQYRMLFTKNVQRNADDMVRTIIFWDQQPNGAAPTLVDILDTTIITLQSQAPYKRENAKRFKILHDSTLVIPARVVAGTVAGNTVLVGESFIHVKKRIPLSRTVKYDGTSAAITAIRTNSLYCLQISVSSAAPPDQETGFRFYYKDD